MFDSDLYLTFIFLMYAPSPDRPKLSTQTSTAPSDGAGSKVKVTQGRCLLSPRYLPDWIKQLIYFSSNEFSGQPGATLIMVT